MGMSQGRPSLAGPVHLTWGLGIYPVNMIIMRVRVSSSGSNRSGRGHEL